MKWIRRAFLIALILTPGCLLLWGWQSVKVSTVPSSSMESTILAGDVVVVRNLQSPVVKRGELVVVNYLGNRTVKRVVAISGDRLKMHEKNLYLNGVLQREPYVQHLDPNLIERRDEFPVAASTEVSLDTAWVSLVESSLSAGSMVIPEGKVFVLGDNRDNSLDSRFLGVFGREQVVGEPWMVLFSAEVDPNTRQWTNVRWERLFKLL